MLTETLQRLERLDGMDSTLFGRELLSFGRLLLDRGWIAGIGYFSRIDVEVMDDIFEEVEVTVDEAAGRYTHPPPFRRKVILSGSLPEVTIKKHATGKGNAGKAEMIAAATARGFDPVDDNHADALALLDWAMTQGGVA